MGDSTTSFSFWSCEGNGGKTCPLSLRLPQLRLPRERIYPHESQRCLGERPRISPEAGRLEPSSNSRCNGRVRRSLVSVLLPRVACAAALVALTIPATASAKLALTFDRASARPGDRVHLAYGDYFTSKEKVVRVYLVYAPILGSVVRPRAGGGIARLGPPPRLAGVHRVGQTLSAESGLTFRVPKVRPGRYAAVIWCSTCQYPYLLANFQSGIPEDAYVRPTKTLLRVR